MYNQPLLPDNFSTASRLQNRRKALRLREAIVLNIGVDESGSFVYSSASDTWNCVAAYAYPETNTRKIRNILSQLKRKHGVGVNYEIKLKKLNENSYLNFLDELLQIEGTLYVVATDASLNTPERIQHHQKSQAAKIVEHIDLMQFDAAKQGLRELADLINGMPPQLYVQMQSQLYLVLMIINTAIFYYVQRHPQSLGNFRWRIDQKNSSKTDYEEAYLQVLPGFLQTASLKEPIPMLAEGNYKWFDRFHYPVGEEPTYLQDVYGIETENADERKLNGFYPVTADIPKKRHTVPKECSCPNAENIAQSSNAKPSL